VADDPVVYDPVADEAAARRFAGARYGQRASGLRALGAGEWSRAYALVLDGLDRVIRFGPYAEDFRKDSVMAAHGGPALPVPAVIDIGPAGDGYFAVSERAHGEALDDLDGAGMRAALPGLLGALDAIAAVDVAGGQGYGIWAPDGTGPEATWADALLAVSQESERVRGWRAALAASPVGVGQFDRAHARLRELAGDLRGQRHLIHGDLLNRNVLVRGERITAVLDWGNAMYGDWLYDAAWLIYWWPWYPRWLDIDITAELRSHWERRGVLPAGLDRRLTACLLHIGLDAMSYCAFRGRWDDVARNAAQLAALA
jgi:hygromycin-B 4-O-kinase